jgi:hypothetical protein
MFSWIKRWFYPTSQDLYYIHIPKTAGTSFITVLDAGFDEGDIFPAQLWREVNEDLVSKKKAFHLLRGHFGGGCHKQLLNKNAQLLTLLRHPTSLSISTYHFIKREQNTRVHSLVTDNDMSFDEFLNHQETRTKVSDRMTRHLSFDLQNDPDAHELFLSDESVQVVEKWKKKNVIISDSQRLKRAIRRLDSCRWFGLVERFDQSMQWFCYQFHRPPLYEAPRLNAFKPNQEISAKSKEQLKVLNAMDYQLYTHAENKFNKEYEAMISDLESLRHNSQETLFELLDRKYLNHYQNRTGLWRDSVDFDFSMPMLGSGWHRREKTHPENTTFRWTSHPNSFLDFWMQPGNYTLSLRVINSVDVELLNNDWILVNGEKLNTTMDTDSGVVRIYTIELDENNIKNGLLRIQFNQRKIVKHSDAFGSDDFRSLGVAVNWIKIKKR